MALIAQNEVQRPNSELRIPMLDDQSNVRRPKSAVCRLSIRPSLGVREGEILEVVRRISPLFASLFPLSLSSSFHPGSRGCLMSDVQSLSSAFVLNQALTLINLCTEKKIGH